MYRIKRFYFKKNVLMMEKLVDYLTKMKIDTNYEFKTTIDDLDIILIISKYKVNDTFFYSFNAVSPYILDENNDRYILYSYVISDDLHKIFKMIEEFKTYKWLKTEKRFVNPEEYQFHSQFNECIHQLVPLHHCPVCMELCNERLKCDHILCLKCRSHMIKHKKYKCPLCRDKNLKIFYDHDEHLYMSDEEED